MQRPWFMTPCFALALMTLLVGAGHLHAELPLEAMVQQALQNNPGLKAQRAKIAAAQQVPSQVKALPDPMADIEFMNIGLSRSTGSDALTQGISVGLTQTLPYPGKRGLAAKAAEGEAAVQEARLALMEWRVRSAVMSAAYRFRTAAALLQINTQTIEALHTAVESALARYSTGGGTQADVLLAQTAVTKSTSDRSDLEKQREVSRARIESLLAAPVEDDALEGIELPKPSALPGLEPLLAFVDAHAPEVAIAQAEVAVADTGAEAAKKNFKPDFIVGGRFRYKDMTMGGQNYLTAMAGMTLPFFHRKDRYQPALDEALQRQQGALEEVNEARNTARFDLAEAYQSAARDAKVFTLYDQGLLLQARQAYEATLSAYTTGRSDFSALMMSLTSLYAYEAEAVMARGEFPQRVAEMEAVLGRPLSEAVATSPVNP
jgi:outer membrane protein TolC